MKELGPVQGYLMQDVKEKYEPPLQRVTSQAYLAYKASCTSLGRIVKSNPPTGILLIGAKPVINWSWLWLLSFSCSVPFTLFFLFLHFFMHAPNEVGPV